jgi:hypothetical protein
MAATALLPFSSGAFAEPATEDLMVLARAKSIILSARETHVVLAPVPVRRRPPPKARPKGTKPAPPRMLLVLRDVIIRDGASAYDVFLVLEGPNVFEATSTRVEIGPLESGRAPGGDGAKDEGGKGGGKGVTIVLDANDAFARLRKTRGFNIRRLRVVFVRRGVKDEQGVESVPPDPTPPEIGAVELAQS